MFDIITVGSATVDVFAHTENCARPDPRFKDEYLAFRVGAKVLIEELRMSTGGGGTNTAVALARLGLKTACIGKIGLGENSHRILLDLQKEKVIPLFTRSKTSRTGYSVILDTCTHDRVILNYRGSNSTLKFSEINLNKAKAKWYLLCSMKHDSKVTLQKLAAFAKKKNKNVMFVFNPFTARLGIQKMNPLLKNVDITVMNKEEAVMLTNKKNVKQAIEEIKKHGPKITIVTDAKKDLTAYNATTNTAYIASPSTKKPVETTGAGDAFASSFLAGMIKKNNIKFALQLAMTNAESVVSHHGAKNKLLTYSEALKKMKRKKYKAKSIQNYF